MSKNACDLNEMTYANFSFGQSKQDNLFLIF